MKEKEIEVTVSMTISKTMKVFVDDYSLDVVGIDEENQPIEQPNYTQCDLRKAVLEQKILPHNAHKCLDVYDGLSADVYDDLKDWIVDELEVLPNETVCNN